MTSPIRPRLVIRPSPTKVADTVAAALLEELHIRSSARDGRPVHVVLTGGTVASLVHRRLAQVLGTDDQDAGPGAEWGIDWSNVHFWWGDERWLAPDDADRNEGQARRDVLDALPVPATNLHPMPALPWGVAPEDAERLQAAALAATHEMHAHAPATWDIVMLGTGPDGHVASLFPGQHHGLDHAPEVVAVPDSPKPPPERLSMSYPRLAATELCWVFATGLAKADAVAHAYQGGGLPLGTVTAAVHRGGGRATWYLDAEAASPLTG